jgi:hypothetical protein
MDYAKRSEEASEDIVRFNPGDISSWVYLARASRRVANVFYQQGHLREALATLEAAITVANDERLPPSAAAVFEETWYELAELQMKLGMRAAAERTLVSAAAATEASASQFAEGSARRRMTLGRPMAERPWLALQVGEPAAAYQGFQPVIEELDQLQFPDDDRLGRDIRGDYLSWVLRGQGDAAIQLSQYAEAEALARRRIALPDAAFGDVVRERADREQQLALALAKLGRRGEAREVLEPALEHLRKRRADGEKGTEFQLSFAEALYASAIAQEDDAAGRRARKQALEAATAELDGLSDEARQLYASRLLRDWIAQARLM